MNNQVVFEHKIEDCLSASDSLIKTYLVTDKKQEKKILKFASNESMKLLLENEQTTLESLKTESVKQIIEPSINLGEGYFLRAFYPGQSLSEYLDSNGCCSEEETLDILSQLVSILLPIQQLERPLVHNDLRLENVIRDESGQLVLLDFTRSSDLEKYPQYTAKHSPPEIYIYKTLMLSTDVYALGCIALQLLSGHYLHHLQGENQNFDYIWEPFIELSEPMQELLEGMLTIDTTRRYQSMQVLRDAIGAVDRKLLKTLDEEQQSFALNIRNYCNLMIKSAFPEALEHLTKLVESKPEYSLLWTLKGLCHEALKQVAEAEIALMTALKYQKKLSFSIVAASNFWLRQQQIQEALNILESRYFPFTPSSIECIETLSYCYYYSEQDNKGIPLLQSLLSWVSKAVLHELLAHMFQRSQRYSDAIDVWHMLLKKRPEVTLWRYYLALCLIQLEQPQLALKQVRKILDQKPEDESAQKLLLSLTNSHQ